VNHTITYLNHKITCSFEYIEAGSYSGYYWITTSEVPYYPCPLISKTLEGHTFDNFLDWNDPSNSKKADEAFKQKGIKLLELLKEELGSEYEITLHNH
jgi:hypothetical protein